MKNTIKRFQMVSTTFRTILARRLHTAWVNACSMHSLFGRWALVLFCAACLTACTGARKAQKGSRVPADFRFGLTRTVCFGTCPDFTLTVDATGKLEWEGRNFVRTVGKATRQLTPEQLTALVEIARKIQAGTYAEKYDEPMLQDVPSFTVECRVKGKESRTMGRYQTPQALIDLVEEAEKVMGIVPGEYPVARRADERNQPAPAPGGN